MSDWRVRLLKFMEQRPVLISMVQSTVMTGISVPAFLMEQHNGCVQIVRLWLIGAFVRVWLRMYDSLWLASLTGQPVTSTSVRCAYMWQECLDVFGVMWQILMSIVVFNNGKCAHESPLMFISCMIYLFGVYLYVSTYLLVVRSLTLRPPTTIDDVRYLANLRQAAIDLRNQLSNTPPQNTTTSPGATQIDPNAWGAWLESYGSFAVPYEKSELHSVAQRSRASTGVTERDHSGGSYGSAGDVELGRISSDTRTVQDADTIFDSVSYTPMHTQQTPREAHAADVGDIKAEEKVDMEQHTIMNINTVDNAEICAICLLSFDALSSEDKPIVEISQREKEHIVVRYPCAGNHYFHAHCLHQWLQADAVRRAVQPRRVIGPVGNSDVRTLVTCPICREHPSMPIESQQEMGTV